MTAPFAPHPPAPHDPAAGLRRGWCPGARRPMRTGDGHLVRLRLTAGVAPAATARAIAALARAYGNGAIDLSARANLQIRGVSDAGLAPLTEDLAALGLLDADAATETVRNVIASPLAGHDPAALVEVLPVVQALEAALVGTPPLHALPAKFCWLVDDGGSTPMDGVAADVRFRAVPSPAGPCWAVGLDAGAGIDWIGRCPLGALVDTAVRLATAFLDAAGSGPDAPRRMRHLSPAARRQVAAALPLAPLAAPPLVRAGGLRPGALTRGNGHVAVAAGLPFGRIEARALADLADLAADHGAGELRLAPWRLILLPGVAPSRLARVLEAARSLGLMTTPDDPRAAMAVCPGASGCDRGTTDTHADAVAVARCGQALFDGSLSLHLSGCVKGCARPAAASLALVAEGGRYGLVRDGDARAKPMLHVSPEALVSGFGRLAAALGARPAGTSAAEGLRRLADADLATFFAMDPHE